MEIRCLVWLTREQVDGLSISIANALECQRSNTLLGIHNEIAVANQRYISSRIPSDALSRALGRNPADIPINLSVEEISLLMSLGAVSDQTKASIARAL